MQALRIDLRLDFLHDCTGLREPLDKGLEHVRVLPIDLAIRIAELHGDFHALKRASLGLRQLELPAVLLDLVGTAHDIEHDVEIGSAARERSDAGDVTGREAVGQ